MIFEKVKTIVIGIPKNASVSIQKGFQTACGLKESIHDHNTISETIQEGLVDVTQYTTVAVCRHPYDRFLSAYRYLINNDEWFMTIDETLDFLETMQEEPECVFMEYVNCVLHPQWWYTHYRGQRQIATMLRYETIARDWRVMANQYRRQYKINFPVTLTKQNSASDGLNWWQVLNSTQLKRMAALYSKDFHEFEYSKAFSDQLNVTYRASRHKKDVYHW